MGISYEKDVADKKVNEILGRKVKWIEESKTFRSNTDKPDIKNIVRTGKIISFGVARCQILTKQCWLFNRIWSAVEFA